MRRLLLLVAATGALLASCVVVEREPEVRSQDPPVVPDDDLPEAAPQPLGPQSDHRLIGSLGWALLSPEVPRAVLEVDELGGATLTSEAVQAMEDALRRHGGKEEVEVLVEQSTLDRQRFSLEDLVSTAAQHRDRSSGGDTVAVHVLVLPGSHETEGVPGVAFQATTMALFPEQIRDRLPAGAAHAAFEAAIAVHELGHLFGLVNHTGAGEAREDPDHPGHTDDRDSVMYWAVESPSFSEVFDTGPPSGFTEGDREEMDRIRRQRPGTE